MVLSFRLDEPILAHRVSLSEEVGGLLQDLALLIWVVRHFGAGPVSVAAPISLLSLRGCSSLAQAHAPSVWPGCGLPRANEATTETMPKPANRPNVMRIAVSS